MHESQIDGALSPTCRRHATDKSLDAPTCRGHVADNSARMHDPALEFWFYFGVHTPSFIEFCSVHGRVHNAHQMPHSVRGEADDQLEEGEGFSSEQKKTVKRSGRRRQNRKGRQLTD